MLFTFLVPLVLASEDHGDLPVTVRVSVDKSSVNIGDKVKYTLEVTSEKDINLKMPEFSDNLGDFSINDFGQKEGGFWGDRTFSRWYVLDIYETGEYTIPGAVVMYKKPAETEWREIVSEPVRVEVVSVLSDDQNFEIRDIRGPVSFFNPLYIYILIALILAAVITVLIIVLLKKRRKKETVLTQLRPAHEVAYEALKALMARDYVRTGKVRTFYFELSNILRHYIEDRFKLKAPEMTTEEFLGALKESEVLNYDQKESVREFLSGCDLVKFARYLPDEGEVEKSYDIAKKLIDQTREKEVHNE